MQNFMWHESLAKLETKLCEICQDWVSLGAKQLGPFKQPGNCMNSGGNDICVAILGSQYWCRRDAEVADSVLASDCPRHYLAPALSTSWTQTLLAFARDSTVAGPKFRAGRDNVLASFNAAGIPPFPLPPFSGMCPKQKHIKWGLKNTLNKLVHRIVYGILGGTLFMCPFSPLSKGNFRRKMTTIVGNRGQLWTSTLSPHLD